MAGEEAKSYGQIAYEAYCKSSDGKSLISGEVLPSWEQQDGEINKAWNEAAMAIIEAVAKNSSKAD